MKLIQILILVTFVLIGCSKSEKNKIDSSDFPIEKKQPDNDFPFKTIPISTIFLECKLNGTDAFRNSEEKFHDFVSVKIASEYLIVDDKKILIYTIDLDGGGHVMGLSVSGSSTETSRSGKTIRFSDEEFFATSDSNLYAVISLSINRKTGVANYSAIPRNGEGITTSANGKCVKVESTKF